MDLKIEAEGIDTIGGLVFTHLGHLPKAGERAVLDGMEVKVRRVSRRRIQQVESGAKNDHPPAHHRPGAVLPAVWHGERGVVGQPRAGAPCRR